MREKYPAPERSRPVTSLANRLQRQPRSAGGMLSCLLRLNTNSCHEDVSDHADGPVTKCADLSSAFALPAFSSAQAELRVRQSSSSHHLHPLSENTRHKIITCGRRPVLVPLSRPSKHKQSRLIIVSCAMYQIITLTPLLLAVCIRSFSFVRLCCAQAAQAVHLLLLLSLLSHCTTGLDSPS